MAYNSSFFSRFSAEGRPDFLRRAVSALLAFALCAVVLTAPARASLTGATIAVTGGAVGTSAVAGTAALSTVAVPVLGVVGLVLLGCGVNVLLTDASEAAGMTKAKFIETKLTEFATARGQDVNQLLNKMADDMYVAQNGQVLINQECGQLIQQFGNWLFATDAVAAPVSGGAGVGVLNGFNYSIGSLQLEYNSGTYHYMKLFSARVSDIPVLFFPMAPSGTSSGTIFMVSPLSAYDVQRVDLQSIVLPSSSTNYVFTTTRFSGSGNSVYYSGGGSNFAQNNITYSATDLSFTCPANSIDDYPTIFAYFRDNTISWDDVLSGADVPTSPNEDVFTGTEQDWTDNKDLLIPGTGENLVVSPPDVLNPAIEAAASGAYTVSVPDYLNALAQAFEQGAEATLSLPATDVATGVVTSIPVTAVDGTAVGLADALDNGATAAATPVADAGAAVSADTAVSVLTFPLTEIFPFCVVFDAYDMVNLLRADPVCPVFVFSWSIPFVDDPITVRVDFSMWDSLAAIVRTCELFLFCLGLALVTRDLIRG